MCQLSIKVLLIIFEKYYRSLSCCIWYSYVTFSASVAQTVAVSVIGRPVLHSAVPCYTLLHSATPCYNTALTSTNSAGPFALTATTLDRNESTKSIFQLLTGDISTNLQLEQEISAS